MTYEVLEQVDTHRKNKSFEYEITTDNTVTIRKYIGSDRDLVIPEKIDGCDVTFLDDDAFNSNKEIVKTIYLPSKIKLEYNWMFSVCKNLYRVTVSKNNPYYSSEYGILYSKDKSDTYYNPFNELATFGFNSGIYYSLEDGDVVLTNIYAKYTDVKGVEHNTAAFDGKGTLTIPEGITKIKRIQYDESIKKIRIPATVTKLGDAFSWYEQDYSSKGDCINIFVVDDNNPEFCSYDGILYNKSKTTLIKCPVGKTGTITIPSTVKTINEYAFYKCNKPFTAVLPQGIKTIGNSAFAASGLRKINLPDSLTSIGNGAFAASGLRKINLPDSLTSIGKEAFSGTNITSITFPDGLKKINNGVCSGCVNLKQINIPDSVTYIGDRAFCVYEENQKITSFVCPAGVKHIGNYAFAGRFRKATVYKNVKTIGHHAFGYNMEKAEFPIEGFILYGNSNSAAEKYVHDYKVYEGRQRLKFISVDELPFEKMFSYIRNDDKTITLKGYSGNTSAVNVPAKINGRKVRELGMGLFHSCTEIKSIVVPQGVTTIDYCFGKCTNLKKIVIPKSVNSIVSYAFIHCSNIKIYGYPGSYAETFAKEQEIPFVSVLPVNNSRLSSDTVVLSKSIKVYCSASGGTAPYKYSVFYKKASSSKWVLLEANTAKTSVIFKPSSAVKYEIKVIVKDSAGNSASKIMPLSVTKAFNNISKLSADTVKLGGKVKVRCYAEGGSQPLRYTVLYKKDSSAKWTVLAKDSDKNIFVFKPSSAVKYDVRVIIKDSNGKSVTKNMVLNVTK